MKHRNMLLFVVLSTLLLGAYNMYVSRTLSKSSKLIVTKNQKIDEPLVVNTQNLATNSGYVPSSDSSMQFSLQNELFKIVWDKSNGTILQVIWNDGTNFFPENASSLNDSGQNDRFPGIATVLNAKFDGDPEVTISNSKQTVSFANHYGDKLIYVIPDKEQIVNVELRSTRGAVLSLMPKPTTLPSIKGLGRVFSLNNGRIESETWTSILKDPFFSFIGAKRKNLPEATRWLGMDAGIEPNKSSQNSHYFAVIWESYVEPRFDASLAPGYLLPVDSSTGKASARIYLGPKQAESLALFNSQDSLANGIDFAQVVDFGFFGLVAKFLFMILHGIQSMVHNWGLAIILLAIVIRGALWPLNAKTIVQMLRAKELEPFQKALQTKYAKFGSDMAKKAEMQKELMAFYKRNNHNPMGGCLPSILQMPVFFALWSMLNAVFELRHAPFIGWLVDLSASDPYYIIPILMGVSMVIQQMISPTVGDQTQRKIMVFLMPIMFSFFFANTPSGLCLYYLTFNTIGVIQTWLVVKNYKSQPIVE